MDQPQPTQLVAYDPIQRLSYDIWIECINFTILDSAAGPLPYISVSLEWSRALLGTPSLWTTIVVENGQDELARISTFLHLSQNCLIDVVYGESSNTLRSMLRTNAHRIQSIRRTGPYNSLHTVLSNIDYQFPVLQVLDTLGEKVPTSFLLLCPNLTIIKSSIAAVDYIQHLYNVQEVYFTGVRAKDLTRILQHSNYRVLGVNQINAGMYLLEMDGIRDIKSWSANLTSLSTYLSSCLESLSMGISSGLFSALLLEVSFLHGLHTLSLKIILDNLAEPIEPISQGGFKHVHNLSIVFLTSGYGEQDNDVMEMILEALTKDQALRSLGSISLISENAVCGDRQLGCCLQSAINASKITAIIVITSVSSNKPIPQSDPMTTLESLTLSSLFILDYINASQPITLELVETGSSAVNLKSKNLASKWISSKNVAMYCKK